MKKNLIKKSGYFFEELLRSKIVWQSVVVGILTGIIVVLFRLCIESLFHLIQTQTSTLPVMKKILILPIITTLGGLLSGILIFKYAPETKGSGIPYVKMSLERSGRAIRVRTIFVKFFAGVCAIGTGMSLGREGPSVQLGAGVGSFTGRLFKIKGADKDKLIASGAGAAIGATFNAPVAGTIFVIEELLHRFSSVILFPCLVATVSAATFARYILGTNPAFNINLPVISINKESIIVCIILGVIAGFTGVMFSKTIFIFNSLYSRLNKVPEYLKPAFAGFVIGIIGVIIPFILSSGNHVVEMLMANQFPIYWVVIIFLVKFIVTPMCFSSGAAGGIFLPMLMLGAFLGYIVGYLVNLCGLDINPCIVSSLGMAAFMTAVARTPITAVVMVFEMTGGYECILPLMLATAIADLVSEKLHNKPIYAKLVLEQYKKIASENHSDMKVVNDYMTRHVKTFCINDDIFYVLKVMKKENHNAYPIVDDNGILAGIITKSDIEDVLIDKGIKEFPIGRIMNVNPVTVIKQDNLFTCYYRLHNANTEWAIVIDEKQNVDGIITRADILNEI